ncbi:SMI1/KNR4 family protein [Paenibacillus sp. FSL K6-0108]|uniref:SMI1/KNR4 family protein n=1 Tax=Paenibacillus sp. FSL K6-0108 TaxID=2921417 RepID=UPI00324FE194
MYIVTRALKPVPAKELNHFEEQHSISLPTSYRQWLEQYGEGTYTGWMNVQRPDQEVLKPFAEYDFWMHTEDTPVTQNQLQECISIGSSVDGDFLAIHPDVKGLLWLPRHDEHIVLWSCHEADFGETLDRIYCGYYHQDKPLTPAYFEPWNELRNHTFYHLVNVEREDFMKELADLCKTRFKWDAVMENEYTCKLFMVSMGGYLRFNYANGREIALFYEEMHGTEGTREHDLDQFLLEHHCTVINRGGVEE